MTKILYSSSGQIIQLGKQLGQGGEGSVFGVMGQPQAAAKIYSKIIEPPKQAKITAMARYVEANANFLHFCAWPTETLHQSVGGPVVGFLMPLVSGQEPLHHLSSPSQRKHIFPKADWAFLVRVARNIAAAVDAVHAHGHVIGDINESIFMVSPRALVTLIDCDSFQFFDGKDYFLCDVGALLYIPPELQGKSLRGLRRTFDHDAFSLAVLIFQLLFMGRHPFSGVYAGSDDMPPDEAIKRFKFAYGPNAGSRGMGLPPGAFDLDIVTPGIAALFEQAFTQAGLSAIGRPGPRQWVQALDELNSRLRVCSTEPAHLYLGSRSQCPWCEAERSRGFVAFLASVLDSGYGADVDVEEIWAHILAVASPGPVPIPSWNFKLSPSPLPSEVRSAKLGSTMKRLAAAALMLTGLLGDHGYGWLAFVGFFLLVFSGVDLSAEENRRRQAVKDARSAWEMMQKDWQEKAGEGRFLELRARLGKIRDQLMQLNASRDQDVQRLQATLRDQQLRRFLERFNIRDAGIAGIGPIRSATLASFGIETAADVDPHAIPHIKGFGTVLTQALLQWRRRLEAGFVFDSRRGVDPQDIAAVNHKYSALRRKLEVELSAGIGLLEQEGRQALQMRQTMLPQMERAFRALEQARADQAAL